MRPGQQADRNTRVAGMFSVFRPQALFTRIWSSSTSIQTTDACGEPSAIVCEARSWGRQHRSVGIVQHRVISRRVSTACNWRRSPFPHAEAQRPSPSCPPRIGLEAVRGDVGERHGAHRVLDAGLQLGPPEVKRARVLAVALPARRCTSPRSPRRPRRPAAHPRARSVRATERARTPCPCCDRSTPPRASRGGSSRGTAPGGAPRRRSPSLSDGAGGLTGEHDQGLDLHRLSRASRASVAPPSGRRPGPRQRPSCHAEGNQGPCDQVSDEQGDRPPSAERADEVRAERAEGGASRFVPSSARMRPASSGFARIATSNPGTEVHARSERREREVDAEREHDPEADRDRDRLHTARDQELIATPIATLAAPTPRVATISVTRVGTSLAVATPAMMSIDS